MSNNEPVHRLFEAINWKVRMHLKHMLDPYDFKPGEFPFLITLMKHEDGITQKELCNDMLVSKSTTSKRITRLEEKGYIRKQRDPDDRRKTRIYLTEKKAEVKDVVQEMNNEADRLMLKDFSEKEENQLIDYLNRILNNLENLKVKS